MGHLAPVLLPGPSLPPSRLMFFSSLLFYLSSFPPSYIASLLLYLCSLATASSIFIYPFSFSLCRSPFSSLPPLPPSLMFFSPLFFYLSSTTILFIYLFLSSPFLHCPSEFSSLALFPNCYTASTILIFLLSLSFSPLPPSLLMFSFFIPSFLSSYLSASPPSSYLLPSYPNLLLFHCSLFGLVHRVFPLFPLSTLLLASTSLLIFSLSLFPFSPPPLLFPPLSLLSRLFPLLCFPSSAAFHLS